MKINDTNSMYDFDSVLKEKVIKEMESYKIERARAIELIHQSNIVEDFNQNPKEFESLTISSIVRVIFIRNNL